MDLDQLRLFSSVVHYASLSRAAEKMNITQSAASQSIARLEYEMGTKFFTREKRGLRLNQEGRMFYTHVLNILNEFDAAQQEISNSNNKVSGTLHLQVLAASALIPHLLYDFLAANPDVHIHMVQQKNVEEYDLCISATGNGQLPRQAQMLFEEEIMLAVPPGKHNLASVDAIRLKEAQNENFIMMQQGSILRSIANNACQQAGFEPHVLFEADNPSMVREMISMGLGVAFLPRISWMSIVDPKIHLLHIEEPVCRRQIYIHVPRGRRVSNTVMTFQKFAIDYFQKISSLNSNLADLSS